MDSRSKFEGWFEREYKHLESSKYTDVVPHIKYGFWAAWQASRAAIEVELPAYRDATTHRFSAFNDALDICETELRKHGISIKEELPLQHEAREE